MILSLRDKELALADCARLRAFGVPAMAAPVHHALKQPFDYTSTEQAAGFILTSQQAAYALPETGRDRPVYTVGRASAAAARARGYRKVISGPSDGAALAEMISADNKKGLAGDKGYLCWLRARKISFDITAALARSAMAIDEAVVYEMQASPNLPDEALQALRAGQVSGIMALSKAQLSAFGQLLDHYDLWHLIDKIKLYAVSQPVAELAKANHWQMIITARRKRALSVQAAVICDWLNER